MILSAAIKLMLAALVGLVCGVPVAVTAGIEYGLLVGWDMAALSYVIWVWLTIWPLDARRTARLAELEDPTRPIADVLLLTASVASLGAVAVVLAGSNTSRDQRLLPIALGLVSVIVSWTLVHTVYTLGYARSYYEGDDGGVDFNQDAPPRYSDFAYLAFTVGMTFQVSDTDLQNDRLRRLALHHALLSFVFGTGIVATTINLVANLTSGG
jgi:uncharacterized membrane protein